MNETACVCRGNLRESFPVGEWGFRVVDTLDLVRSDPSKKLDETGFVPVVEHPSSLETKIQSLEHGVVTQYA